MSARIPARAKDTAEWTNEKTDDGAYIQVSMDSEEKGSLLSSPHLTPKEEKPSSIAVASAVMFYLVAALVMIICNKLVLNAVAVPIFFLFCQLAIAVVLLNVTALSGHFSIPPMRLQTAKQLAPLILINCTGLIFNTYCLQFVDASFYQVARGLVLPFTVLFSYFLLSARSSLQTFCAVIAVCVGFFFGVSAEHLTVSRIGVFMGVTSSLTTSVHAIVVKRSLPVVHGDTMALAYYNNALSALIVAPMTIIVGEWPVVMEMFSTGGEQMKTFLVGATVTGVFGFLICIAGFLSIKVTSPVTHMVSSAVRGVIQTFLGKWIFGDIISSGRATGIFFILAGSIWYTYAKSQETKPAVQLPLSPPTRSPTQMSHADLSNPASVHRSLGSLSTPMLRHLSANSPESGTSAPSSPFEDSEASMPEHTITFAVHAPTDEKPKSY